LRKTWDSIIVGGGSAGATLAARLSEQRDRQVLLIEAGGRDWAPQIMVPGCLETLLNSRTLNWHYPGDPDRTLANRRLTWAAGRVLGGSSSINGMVFGRGLPADYQRWEDGGAAGWGWDSMLPYFRRLEQWNGPPHPSRGQAGPLHVRRFEETDPSCQAAMESVIKAGLPYLEDYNIGITDGIGLTQANQKNGLRHSVARAYLDPARQRANLTVWTGCHALGLLLSAGRCRGVTVERGGAVMELIAEREVILSAGAIGSPKLLMLSGIGAPEALRPHGIPVRHELPGVGEHLNDHVNIKISAHVDRPTYNSQRFGLSALRHGLQFLANRSGPASSPANHVQAFLRTDPSLASADVQIQLMPFGFGSSQQMRRDGMTAVVSPCHPDVRGQVRLSGPDPLAPPRIAMAMLECREDRQRLLRGCRLAAAALQKGAGGQLYAPLAADLSEASWFDFFTDSAALNWHPTSTCRMGNGADDVVDGELRVRGLTGLRVVDASVMPFVTGGNTNGPVIALAERAAEIISGARPAVVPL
jgi:choline dehydrogenase